jgi:hypothetical protein
LLQCKCICANLMLLYVFMCGERAATTTNVTARVMSMKKKNDLVIIKEAVRKSRRLLLDKETKKYEKSWRRYRLFHGSKEGSREACCI